MNFTLRDFQSKDFETLWRIDQGCFPSGVAYSRPELTAYLSAPGVFTLVAEQGAEKSASAIGFIVAHANRRGIGHVITIDVVAEGRRGGVGSRLLIAAEERLRMARCDRVRLETAVDNAAAIDFYRGHGYAVEKTIAGYYSNGMDAFLMTKKL